MKNIVCYQCVYVVVQDIVTAEPIVESFSEKRLFLVKGMCQAMERKITNNIEIKISWPKENLFNWNIETKGSLLSI